MRMCEGPGCATVLTVNRRAQIRTCSPRCRVALHRATRRDAHLPPAELRQRDRWVRRSATKVPLRVGGGAASSTDRSTWSSYTAAAASNVGVGIGYVLAGDGIVCVDLDHCITDGRPASWVQQILEACPATYIELSPSGTGLHIWGRARVGKGRMIRRGEVAIEIYGSGRYIALGQRYGDAPPVLADLTALIATL